MNNYTLIGIGGTKGKTTTMSIIEYVMLKLSRNPKIISASSTEGMKYNGKLVKYINQRNYFNTFYKNCHKNIDHNIFLCEATSFMLSRGYFNYKEIDIAVYTGIEKNEHMEIHGDFSNYLSAKKRLYRSLKKENVAVINYDDDFSTHIIKCTEGKVLKYGQSKQSDLRIVNSKDYKNYSELVFQFKNKRYELKSKLIGSYNHYNIAAAILVLISMGYKIEDVIKVIKQFENVDGRFEKYNLRNKTEIIIDYAHSVESIKNILTLVKHIYKRKIITVIGCGGERTKIKRPIIGKVVTDLSDYVVLTSDNPRSEEPLNIINDIITGVKKNNYRIILSRERAIEYVIKNFSQSTILLLGKGNESFTQKVQRYFYKVNSNGKKVRCYYTVPKPVFIPISDKKILKKVVEKNGLFDGEIDCKTNVIKSMRKFKSTRSIYDYAIKFSDNIISYNIGPSYIIESIPSGHKLLKIDKNLKNLLEELFNSPTYHDFKMKIYSDQFIKTIENNILFMLNTGILKIV